MTAFGSAALFTHALFGSTRAIPALSSEHLVGAKAVIRRVASECLQLGGEQASVARPVNGKDAPMAFVPPIGVGSQERTLLCQAVRAAVGGFRPFTPDMPMAE
jgi:hypothetical protein